MGKFRELYSAEFDDEDDPMLEFWDQIAIGQALEPPIRLGKEAGGAGFSGPGERSLVLLNWHRDCPEAR